MLWARSTLRPNCLIALRCALNAAAVHVLHPGHPSGLEAVGAGGRLHNGKAITGTNAMADSLSVDGNPVYSAHFEGGMGLRNNETTGVPINDEPETM